MKDTFNIDELFSKAASEPVLTSFDETKQVFLSSISGSSSGGAGKSGFFTKNWILMLSTIAIGTLATVLLLPSTNTQTPKEKKDVLLPETTVETNAEFASTDSLVQTEAIETTDYFWTGGFLPPKELKVHLDHNLMPLKNYSLSLSGPRQFKEPYRFPDLTEDEKRENEKRKRTMVKEVLKMDKNAYAYIPSASTKMDSATVSIQAFYIQKHEVTNIEYKTFLFDLLIQGRNDDFLKAKPDQNKWVEIYGNGMVSMKEYYFSDDSYNEYPVVNVSPQGAEMYCVWLTKQANKYAKEKGWELINDIRIPQRPEWIYAAYGSSVPTDFPWDSDSIKNEAGCYLANFNPGTGNLSADGGFNTVKVDSYNPNSFGLYCMSGNASELVHESTLLGDLPYAAEGYGTAGGSWFDAEESLKILGPDPHSGITEGHPEVGFRVVITHLKGR